MDFKSYGVKKPIANELELTESRFRAVSGPTKHRPPYTLTGLWGGIDSATLHTVTAATNSHS